MSKKLTKSEFCIYMLELAEHKNKLSMIKCLKEQSFTKSLGSLGLKECKDMVDSIFEHDTTISTVDINKLWAFCKRKELKNG